VRAGDFSIYQTMISVFSANFGGMDSKKPMPEQTIDCCYEYFNEQNSPLPFGDLNDRAKAKYFKMQAHEITTNENIVWIDGNIEIKCRDFIETITEPLISADMVLSRHPFRNCVYKEGEFILSEHRRGSEYFRRRYNYNALEKELIFFRSEGFPTDAGLYWCGLFARRNTDKVNQFFNAWWRMNLLWSNFDQTSFVYLVKKYKINLYIIHWGAFYDNKYYKIHKHLKIQ
jgi:hypothetical protein